MTLICNDFHQSLLIINYSIDTSFLWYVVPLFQAVGLQLFQVLGLSSTDLSFELSPQILDGVEIWGLAWSLQQVDVVVPKPCLDDFGCVWGHCPAGRQSPGSKRAPMLTGGGSPQESPYTARHSWSP